MRLHWATKSRRLQAFYYSFLLFSVATYTVLNVYGYFTPASSIPTATKSEPKQNAFDFSHTFQSTVDRLVQFYKLPDPFCAALSQGDEELLTIAENHTDVSEFTRADEDFIKIDCDYLRRGYITDERILPPEEVSFSVAFAIHMYKDVSQFERLFRAIYRPQHVYSIHVDLKSSETIFAAVKSIARCFSNTYLVEDRVDVQWSTIGQVNAELKCMRDLYIRDKRWRYFINLTGQEFPLKTMWQLVRILMALNGANSMEATVRKLNPDRRTHFAPFAKKHNITAVKGAVHIVVVRGFVQYLLESPIATEMQEHLIDAPYPDETFFATINHNPTLLVPGGYLGVPETDNSVYPFINRLKVWWPHPCQGFYQRSVCVFGVRDLPMITGLTRKELFINKLIWNYQPDALDCLEKWLWNNTVNELLDYVSTGTSRFGTRFYQKLQIVKEHQ